MKLPNLELLDYIAGQYFFENDDILNLYKEKCIEKGIRVALQFEVEMFKQTWGSTSTGFDVDEEGCATFGGSAMTDAYTVVFFEPITEIYIVFFDNRICYQVSNANEVFLNDLSNHRLKSRSMAKKYY